MMQLSKSSYFQSLFTALPPPSSIQLILNGDAREGHFKKQGNYTIVQELINGFPYWVQQNGDFAIWFGPTYPSWIVGDTINLGQNFGGIYGPYGVDVWPTQIIDGYEYFGGSSWQYFSPSDLILRDCKRWRFTLSNI